MDLFSSLWFIFLLVGLILIMISVFVYSQFVNAKPAPPRWTYAVFILGIIILAIGILFIFYPPFVTVETPLILPTLQTLPPPVAITTSSSPVVFTRSSAPVGMSLSTLQP